MALRSAFSAPILIALSLNPSVAGDATHLDRRFDIAQIYNHPPANLDVEDAEAGEIARLTLRIDRLERELRQMTGRIEELQHTVQRLEDSHKGQADAAPQSSAAPTFPPSAATTAVAPPPAPARRNDAFDPSRDPAAAGAPRPLGSTPPSAPLAAAPPTQYGRGGHAQPQTEATSPVAREVGAPLDLMQGRPGAEPAIALPPPSPPAPADESAALSAPQGLKDDYEIALSHLHKGQYETAEKGFLAFLAKNSKSRLAPAATFNLGESYFLRGRHREAAEKYLEVSAKYASSAQAPDALLRLGQSLIALGAKEQACASFSEIGVKYPNAPSRTKEAAQRESKKVPC